MNDLQRAMRAERAVTYLLGRLGLTAYDAGTNHAGEPLYYSDLLAHDIAAVQSGDADDATRERLGDQWQYGLAYRVDGVKSVSFRGIAERDLEAALSARPHDSAVRRRPAGDWEPAP